LPLSESPACAFDASGSSWIALPLLLFFAVIASVVPDPAAPSKVASRAAAATARTPLRLPAFDDSTRDLRGFVERRREHLAHSHVAYDVSQALEECAAVTRALALDEGSIVPVASSPTLWQELAASEALAAPCRGFEGYVIRPGEVMELLRYSAERGEPRARARMLLFRDIAASKEDAMEELPELLATMDPGVIRDVGAFLARGETSRRLGGEDVSTSVAVLAWELAACDLGYECGPTSRITLAQCAFAGNCSAAHYEDALDRAELPEDMEHARRLRAGLVRALRERDWTWLGLAE